MKLETNNNHKKVDLTNINKKGFKNILIGSLITISLFSGSMVNAVNYIDNNLKVQIEHHLGSEYNDVNQLKDLNYLSLNLDRDCDLSFLNDCNNVKDLVISYGDNVNSTNSLLRVNKLDKLESISIYSFKKFDEFNNSNFRFLRYCDNLKEINLSGLSVDCKFLESFTNIEYLRIGNNIINGNIDFSKFKNLKELEFYNIEEYDLAIYLDDDTINKLLDNGVNIVGDVDISKVIEINNELNNIVDSLDIDRYSSDKEKLNSILIYILDELSYDSEVSNNLKNNNVDKNLIRRFYNDGYLFGALEGNSSICGNYSALFQALASRLDMNSYFMYNNYHAWNMVSIDDEYYYVDSTYLDGMSIDIDEDGKLDISKDVIKSNNGTKLEWYMKDINKVSDKEHMPVNMPLHIEIKPISNNENNNENAVTSDNNYTNEDKYQIIYNGIEKVVPIGVVIGMLTLFGICKKKNDKKNRNRRYK